MNIKFLLSKMTNVVLSNLDEIEDMFESLTYTDDEKQSILHILVNELYDEEKCLLAIKSLLEYGLSPNLEDDYQYNFIQTALYAGYSEEFIFNIITESLKYDLDVNHVDSDKDTIMHTAIYSDNYLGDLERIYELLCDNGFDSSKEERAGRNLIDTMIFEKEVDDKYSFDEIEKFRKIFEERYFKASINKPKEEGKTIDKEYPAKKELPLTNARKTISRKDILELEKYGQVLNNKNYITSPTIGREKELKNLMVSLAQEKKNPIIVGESGVGKTAIVDELAYRIKTGQVPNFLKDKIILEVNPSDVVAGCRYLGMFEDNMTNLMKLCERLDAIVFIDEIHTIYGVGSTKGKDNDMSSMLKHYIDRSSIKVIGTTTENEYNEYFGQDALKRRFEKITIKEPTDDVLYQIIDKVIGDYTLKTGLTFENENIKSEVVNVILNATLKNHRVYNDRVNNPDLSISIIDKAFAFAKVFDNEFITSEHFIESFEYCDRIYGNAKEQAIISLKGIDTNISKPTNKILKIDFNKFKK